MAIFAHWPNRITAIRFVGALALFALFAIYGDGPLPEIRTPLVVAFALFVVVASTDFLDGYLARRYGHVSAFGRIADPFVDKVLVVGALVYMAAMPWSQDLVPATVTVVILAREFLVTGIRGYVESIGREFPADGFGKIKMILQCMAISAVLWARMIVWPEGWARGFEVMAIALVWLTLAATLGSGITYALKTRRILAEASA